MLWLTTEKLAATLERFKNLIYAKEQNLPGLEFSPEPPVGCKLAEVTEYKNWRWVETGGSWGATNTAGWFRGKFQIPTEWQGQKVFLRLRFGTGGDIDGPEGLIFLNGREFQAIDQYHRRMLLTEKAQGGEQFDLVAEVFAGLHNIRPYLITYSLAVSNKAAEEFYYNLEAGFQVVKELPDTDLLHIELLTLLNRAYNLVDMSQPNSSSFQSSLDEANLLLREGFKRLQAMSPQQRPSTIITGHAHIDVAWLWPYEQTRRKAARTFTTVLKLMEQYPKYHFTQSQPQLYQYVKEDHPAIYEQIKQRIKEGRWEPTGGMWLESDCNLTSGESLVRQFLFGQRFFEQEFGQRSRVLWLPDAFGYTAALPQIMQKAGVEGFMTTKISWSQLNRFPYDTFWWRGLDGSEILTHFVTTPQKNGEVYYTYNGSFVANEVIGNWKNYRQKDFNSELLYLYGWGDGGGGPTAEMLERAARWEDFPGLPRCEQGHSESFFDRLNEKAQNNLALPHWTGELYLEYHRGTFTSQAWIKKANRQNEFRLREAELWASLAWLLGDMPHQEKLNPAWEKLLLNQFHDVLPGSSIHKVYEDARLDHAFIEQTANEVRDKALTTISTNIGDKVDNSSWLVFNSLGWARNEPVLIPDGSNLPPNIEDAATGQSLLLQAVENGTLISGLNTPAFGYSVVSPKASNQSAAKPFLEVDEKRLENARLKVEFDEQGEISRIFDKAARREVLEANQKGNQLIAFEDKPLNYDAWDIDRFYKEKARPVKGLNYLKVVESGLIRATIEIERPFLSSIIRQRISLTADSARLDFATFIDWREKQILLKAAFPVAVHADTATYDVAFGNLQRSTRTNTSWDLARFETCAHKWADLSEGDYGVSLLNDCKYGYDIEDNLMRLTLLKSAISPDPEADQEEHSFTYSLFPHAGNWREGGTVPQAYQLNIGQVVKAGASNPGKKLPASFSLIESDRSGVIVDTVKVAENGAGLIIRLYECYNQRGQGRLKLAFPVVEAYETNLLEDKQQALTVEGSTITYDIKPFEIKTIWCKLAQI